MASTRISAPARGVTHQLSRLSIRRDALPYRCSKCLSTPIVRSITTSASPQASITPITTSVDGYTPIKPLEQQTVLATIHQFPSLEPLRFQTYPANHLYLPTRRDILHRAVVYEGDSARSGTASTKTRYEVRGSARKIRPQKGSGRARLGDKKSPMLKGGGVAFGPKPRDFATALPKKVYDLAWRTALSYRYRKGELIIVDNAMEIESPSTRLLEDIIKHQERLRGKGKSLMVTLEVRPLLEDALDRLGRGEQTLTWDEVDVKDLLSLSRVIIERDALQNILRSHQEDLTHVPVAPSRLVRSNPPSDLESIIGWAEFRDLQLLPRDEQDAARPAAYESVAFKRYDFASKLPSNSPQRTDLNISVYNLTAESKALQFAQQTGLKWETYAADKEYYMDKLPKVQILDYQIEKASSDAFEASQVPGTTPTHTLTLDIGTETLRLQRLKLLHKAALLSALTHEHFAEAKRMSGDEKAADAEVDLAAGERTTMDDVKMEMMDMEVKIAEMRVRAVKGSGGEGRELEKARERLAYWTEKVEERNRLALAEGEVEGEQGVVDAAELEAAPAAPIGEEVKREEKEKR